MVTDTPTPPARRSLSSRLNLALHLDFPKKSEGGGSLLGETYLPAEFSIKYGDLGETLGAGTVARVRRATRKSDGQEVAIKVIASQDEEMRQFAKDEYNVMDSLRHPNIVKVEGFYESPSCLLMIMELCPAGSLDSHIGRRGVLPETMAVVMFGHLLGGLHYLHLKRVVHRDIKPQNLLLQDDATQERGEHILRITDFNSARRIGLDGGQGLMLSERGTAFYSAPELRFGRIWNERVDVWASGMCFYFMRHGCAPLNIFEPGHAQLLRSGRLPELNCAGFSDLARTLLLQCLTVEMRDRPAAMELVLHPLFHEHNDDVSSTSRVRASSCEASPSHNPSARPMAFEEDQAKEGPGRRPSATSEAAASSAGRRPSAGSEAAASSEVSHGSADTSPSPIRQQSCPFARMDKMMSSGDKSAYSSAPPRMCLSAADGWKESRNHSDVAQRLANIKCERALTLNGHLGAGEPRSLEDERTDDIVSDLPSPGFAQRRADRQSKRSAAKAVERAGGNTVAERFWTTHGAIESIES